MHSESLNNLQLTSAPRSGHVTNHSKLSYLINTQHFMSIDDSKQVINFGQKPKELPSFRRVWAQDMNQLKYLYSKPFILDEARRYQEYLEREGVNTKSEVAAIFGVSRARVMQYLNLLKLPKSIIQFLDKNRENAEVKKHFTERGLRPLTWVGNDEAKIEEFNKIVSSKVK